MENKEEKLANMQKPIFEMGNTSKAFRGNSDSEAVKEIYGKSDVYFADIIKSELTSNQEHTLLDIGSARGELLSSILSLLKDYSFSVTATDTNSNALAENPAKNKVVADAENLPFPDHSMDIVLMRYVLQFNSLESQEAILSEISRVIKELAIVQHGGSDSVNPQEWRGQIDQIFNNTELPQIKRNGMLYSSVDEVEALMNKKQIKFKRLQSRKINGLSQVFIERYSLKVEQIDLLKKLLGDKDYIIQTTWIIYPKN